MIRRAVVRVWIFAAVMAAAGAACGRLGYDMPPDLAPPPTADGGPPDGQRAADDSGPDVGPAPLLDVAGEYTAVVTNGKTTCNDPDWREGMVTTNVPITIAQDGAALTAEVRGTVGVLLSITYQSSTYRGLLRADRLELDLVAANTKREGACVHRPTSTVAARATGDFVTGTIRHTSMTTGGPDCAAAVCVSEQTFNATRPAKPR